MLGLSAATLISGAAAQQIDAQRKPPQATNEDVMRTVRDRKLNRFEAAIFIWSQTDPAARKTFDNVYKIRLDFIRKLFHELGFSGDDAEMRAQLFMGYLAWEYTGFCPQSKAKSDRLLKLRLQLLTEK